MHTTILHNLGTPYSEIWSCDNEVLISEYEKNGSSKNFVDHVFGGEMTSTIMCQQCKTVRIVDRQLR